MAETLYAPPAKALSTGAPQLLFTASAKCIVDVVVANSTAAAVAATIAWTDASAANASAPMIPGTNVAANDTLGSFRKTLEVGDTITGLAGANGALTAAVNVFFSES